MFQQIMHGGGLDNIRNKIGEFSCEFFDKQQVKKAIQSLVDQVYDEQGEELDNVLTPKEEQICGIYFRQKTYSRDLDDPVLSQCLKPPREKNSMIRLSWKNHEAYQTINSHSRLTNKGYI